MLDTRQNPPGKDELLVDVTLLCGPLDVELLTAADLIVVSPGSCSCHLALQSGASRCGNYRGYRVLREAKAPWWP